MTKLNPTEIEAYAVQMADPDFDLSSIETLIGHLPEREFEAVFDRAAEISREYGKAALSEADTLAAMNRLAHATGCPHGEPVIPWLQERGLIEQVDDGWRFKTAKPGAVT
ncbi:hypothetical protein [Bradyrhizobium sp. Ash2021]|uniref:hypothetical protein n=1 Tax=Bradyrhizobium sp. Ash2021 TaxID=2954771 RepID=UPI00281529C5|nr:hypothetical protein [Bradyrhizobium sp. Ash2021]WMT79499.1 hypothetical protein NL528_46470 [Bradyrhizobium sp. Ash2021]